MGKVFLTRDSVLLKNRYCIITYRRNKLPTEKEIFLSGSRYIKNIEKGKSAEFYEIL